VLAGKPVLVREDHRLHPVARTRSSFIVAM
jgi:hypothetical protein